MHVLRLRGPARFLLLAALLFPFAAPAPAQSAADIAKVVGLMQANSYNFVTTRSTSVWAIHFTGAHLKDIKVVIAVGEEPDAPVIAFVTVTEKRTMPVNTDFMRALLEENHKLDRVKVGYDADGDLEVRIDAVLRVTDAQEFGEIVTQVKNCSDEIYGTIQPQLLQ
jgi:hypothetical protein